MCRLAFVSFDDSVPQTTRREVMAKVLKESWDLGNKDGAGFVSWTGTEEPIVGRALTIETLQIPEVVGKHALLHARFATCGKEITNVHPIEGGGAYLVHNGVVHASSMADEALFKTKTKTTNDSELILKAYLTNKRDLCVGLEKLSGMANVALWDRERAVLSIYPDSGDFLMWYQDGVLVLTQETGQASGTVVTGLGHPYSFDKFESGNVYEVDLSNPAQSIVKSIEDAMTAPLPVTVSPSYQTSWGYDEWDSSDPMISRQPYTVYDKLYADEQEAIRAEDGHIVTYTPGGGWGGPSPMGSYRGNGNYGPYGPKDRKTFTEYSSKYPIGQGRIIHPPKTLAGQRLSKKRYRALGRALDRIQRGGTVSDLTKAERKAYLLYIDVTRDLRPNAPLAASTAIQTAITTLSAAPVTPPPPWWKEEDPEKAAVARREALDAQIATVQGSEDDPDDVSPKYPDKRRIPQGATEGWVD
jgi:hypothetical protein